MPYILTEKIKIGISACNFGARVRWNIRGWDKFSALDRERNSFIWTPVCPEVLSGLGVPRATIKLVGGNGDEFWESKAKVKNKKGEIVTEQIKKGTLAALENVKRAECEAFVFMEGSPTCGIYRTTLKNKRLGKPPGTFGSLLLKEELFLIPAQDLQSPVKWWDWRRRLHAFIWLKRKEIKSKKELYEIWHNYKFICQEADLEIARKIGEEIAQIDQLTNKVIQNWKKKVLMLLRQPSTFPRIKSILQKHFAHYNKHFNGKTEKISLPPDKISKTNFINQIKKMEKKAFIEKYDFGGVPVIFRSTER